MVDSNTFVSWSNPKQESVNNNKKEEIIKIRKNDIVHFLLPYKKIKKIKTIFFELIVSLLV